MTAFVTHGTIRVKGTENNYDPVVCQSPDPECVNKPLHMHCPFCVKAESFTDPVILRAHYRVKHVDKGIEFAGLKMLRCCDNCDIIGTIKGMKEFKGAHWHCYKCRNGFNRRDEALKHYRTHFRNPMTTFKIQIAQEVNKLDEGLDSQETRVMTTETISAEELMTIHPALTEAVMTSSPADTLAANETVGTTEGSTIMIIQEDQLDRNTLEGVLSISPVEHSTQNDSELQLKHLESNYKILESEKQKMEEAYVNEITQMKQKIEEQEAEIFNLKKREQELLEQLSVPLDDRIQDLLVSLKSQHEDLLHQQLAQLRRTSLQSTATNSYFVISKPNNELDYSEHGIVVIPGVTSENSGTVLSVTDSVISNSMSSGDGTMIEAESVTEKHITEDTEDNEEHSQIVHTDSIETTIQPHDHEAEHMELHMESVDQNEIMVTQDVDNDMESESPPAKLRKT